MTDSKISISVEELPGEGPQWTYCVLNRLPDDSWKNVFVGKTRESREAARKAAEEFLESQVARVGVN